MVKIVLEMEAVETNKVGHKGRSPLLHAIYNDDEAMVKLLLDSGRIDLNQQYKQYGATGTALRIARSRELPRMVGLLVKAGAVE